MPKLSYFNFMKESETYEFSVEHNGKIYKCSRTVSGKRRCSQTIHVSGYGSRKDPSMYGDHGYPIKGMATDAMSIALQILEGRP
jgi:hypothetical protein